MGKTKDPMATMTSVFFVAELVYTRDRPGFEVQLLLSRPGSSVLVRNRWKAVDGYLDDTQLEDLVSKLSGAARTATEAWCGVQGSLPGM